MTPWLRSDSQYIDVRESRSRVLTRSPQVFPTFTIAGREKVLIEPCLADLCARQAQRPRGTSQGSGESGSRLDGEANRWW
jgi:hypothetical protein